MRNTHTNSRILGSPYKAGRWVLTIVLVTLASMSVNALAGERDGSRIRRGALEHRGVSETANQTATSIWHVLSQGIRQQALTGDGVRTGDLWPTVAESPSAPGRPWVVWSRHNGADFDLAWSRWDGTDWEGIHWLNNTRVEGENQGDDLDADMTFGRNDRPFIVWWRDEGGRGRIYLSMFLNSRWMEAFAVSDFRIDSRHPSVRLVDNTTLEIQYSTPVGDVVHTLEFAPPVAITDDLNPLDLRIKGSIDVVSGP